MGTTTRPLSRSSFARLREDFLAHAQGQGAVRPGPDRAAPIRNGALPTPGGHRICPGTRCFIRNLLIRPERSAPDRLRAEADDHRTCRGFRADPETARMPRRKPSHRPSTLERGPGADRRHVLCRRNEEGRCSRRSTTSCRGDGVMPMHCSANEGPDGDAAVFLRPLGYRQGRRCRPDPARTLIGDDEHGWSDDGLFQFRRRLLRQDHPACRRKPSRKIYATTPALSARCWRNVVLDDQRQAGFRRRIADRETPAAPIRCTSSRMPAPAGRASQPKNIIMLTADAFGRAARPIARLTPAQAMYHFLSGYTAQGGGVPKRA